MIPPRSSAKRHGFNHMISNLTALGVLGVSWAFRDGETWEPSWVAVAMEAAAGGLVIWGGWLGGILVYRDQIGVDHRYAHAGKWSEVAVEPKAGRRSRWRRPMSCRSIR